MKVAREIRTLLRARAACHDAANGLCDELDNRLRRAGRRRRAGGHRHGAGVSSCRSDRDAGRSRFARALRRPGVVGLRRHGAGRHAAAGESKDSRHARTGPARLAALRRSGSERSLVGGLGRALRRALLCRRSRLAGRPRAQVPAGGQLGRAWPPRRRQFPAALPRPLGYRARAGPAHDCRPARRRFGRPADAVARPPRHGAGACRRAGLGCTGSRRSHRPRKAARGQRRGAGHRRHQREP